MAGLRVIVHHSSWTYGKVTLEQGEREVESPSADLLHAIGAAEDAGALTIDEAHSDKASVKTARGAVETAEEAMKQQDARLADTDPEHIAEHLAWEIDRRLELAADPDIDEETAARLISAAEGIAVRLEELGQADHLAAARKKIAKAKKASDE